MSVPLGYFTQWLKAMEVGVSTDYLVILAEQNRPASSSRWTGATGVVILDAMRINSDHALHP
jgi:hypothetical protein